MSFYICKDVFREACIVVMTTGYLIRIYVEAKSYFVLQIKKFQYGISFLDLPSASGQCSRPLRIAHSFLKHSEYEVSTGNAAEYEKC